MSIQKLATYHFRRSRWGDTTNDVLAAENGAPRVNNDRALAWVSNMLGFDCLVVYTFDDDRLVSGCYIFDDPDDGMDGVVYSRLAESLTAKYGDGEENIRWLNPIRRINIETIGDLGNAAGAHYLSAMSHWQTEAQTIVLSLQPKDDEYGAQVILGYYTRTTIEAFAPAATDLNLL